MSNLSTRYQLVGIHGANSAISYLHHAWDELVENESITGEAMTESLREQINGVEDMSAEELSDEAAKIMGWDPDDLDDDKLDTWEMLVVVAAKEYLARNASGVYRIVVKTSEGYRVYFVKSTSLEIVKGYADLKHKDKLAMVQSVGADNVRMFPREVLDRMLVVKG